MTDMKYRAWKTWDNGECPVPPDTWVEVHRRSGLDLIDIGQASQYDWRSGDILRYRLCAPGERPSSTQPDADGWIEWSGGECPVPPDTMVEMKFVNGYWGTTGVDGAAGRFVWTRPSLNPYGDIVAYRVLSKEPEPNNTVNTPSQKTTEKLTGRQLDKARWRRADRTHPDNYACAGQEAARLARIGWEPGVPWEDEARALLEEIRANYRGCSPGSIEENLKGRINVLLKDPHDD